MIEEKDLNKESLIEAIDEMFSDEVTKEVKENLREIKDINSSTIIMDEIKKILKGKDEKKKEEA